MKRIPYAKPSITQLEIDYVKDAMENCWGDRFNYPIENFEREFSMWVGTKYAISTSSCTGALHIALTSLGIGPGDEVILPECTWIATASAIKYVGATPVFVDILPGTWCIDPRKVEDAITPHTKAIIAVHLYGNWAAVECLDRIAKEYNIALIEDAAQAIGTEMYPHKAGSIGSFGTFSFHGSKTICTGEGGMLVTNSDELYEKALTISNHGRSVTKQFWFDMIGNKYKMMFLQAAIGCAQMERIDELISRKREIFEYYYEHFKYVSSIKMNPEPGGTKNGYWMPTVVFDKNAGVTREKLQLAFARDNIDASIDARVFFYPLSSMPMFTAKPENINAYDIPSRAMNLPSYHDMTDDDQDRVIESVYKAML